jgi:GTP cyclohydrolase I
MRDVASERDERGITIQRVGVRGIHLPVMIREKSGGLARVVGQFDASVELPHYERGTHMSRFVEILAKWSKKAVAIHEFEDILREIQTTFGARAATLSLSFKYFLDKCTPVSREPCQLDYDCRFDGSIREDDYTFTVGATVPIITLCPCSKEISERGAHSQRAELSVRLRTRAGHIIWLEDLIPLLEQQGSYGIFPMLKRRDEKAVTEGSFDNPKFVEDVVRDTILALRSLDGAVSFSAECQSFESIHNHNAYAYAEDEAGEWERPG